LFKWGDSLPEWLVNGGVGLGSGVVKGFSLGLVDPRWIGVDTDTADQCSWIYKGGEYAGIGLSFTTGGVASLNAGSRSVFYAGSGALDAARAGKGAGLLLEDTVGGKILGFVDQRVGFSDSTWRFYSRIFAANAKGEAQVFLRDPIRPGATWNAEKSVLEWWGNTVIVPR
jgi:hypothetical protein